MAAGGGASASRLRGPITWVSAVVTITGLYSLYQYQYNKQLNRQKSVGKPELGGPFTLMDVDGKIFTGYLDHVILIMINYLIF